MNFKTKKFDFPTTQFFNEDTEKKQIYLHHTAGGGNAELVYKWWSSNPERVATCVVIGENGDIVQGFSSKKWAYHLGLKTNTFKEFKLPFKSLDKISIGVELCCWGNLNEIDGKFYNYVNREVDPKKVITLDKPFRGFEHWYNYSDEQINSLKELLLYWGKTYDIPLDYNEDIFSVNARALSGDKGIYTHNSVRKDKVDIYPHPKLIEMLKSLKK